MRSYTYPPGVTGNEPEITGEESPQARITASLFDLLAEGWNDACQFGDEITDDYDDETGEMLGTLEMIGENSLSFYTENGLAVSITVTVEAVPEEVPYDGDADYADERSDLDNGAY